MIFTDPLFLFAVLPLSVFLFYPCFSAFIPTSRAQPADLILESGSFLAEGVSLGG